MDKNILSQDRLIVALDVPTVADAKQMVESLGEVVTFYKIGLELFMSGEYFELLDWKLAAARWIQTVPLDFL